MDASPEGHLYGEIVDSSMMNSPLESFHELGKIVLKAAESGGSCLREPNGVKRQIESNLIRDLILQRK